MSDPKTAPRKPRLRGPRLISVFTDHHVAPNLLMVMMIIVGIWALQGLNKQFFPTFALDFVNVKVTWTGAASEDVERSIVNPLEQELRTVDGLRALTSTSAEGRGVITLEFEDGIDMGVALDQVKERVDLVRNLPSTSEEPEVSRIVRYEPIVRMLVTSNGDLRGLRSLIYDIERRLLDEGIDKVIIKGLPEQELAIQVSTQTLRDLNTSLSDIASRVGALSKDAPAGTIGRGDVSRQLRALEQKRTVIGFEDLPVLTDEDGRLLRLSNIADVELRPRAGQSTILYRGRPAVELQLRRAESGDSLDAAQAFERWLETDNLTLPEGVEVHVFDESWELIRERIMLLLKNGGGGLILVVAILFLFLNGRVAFWVAVGIPVSFMAALGVLFAFGGSINMISLFALIMTLGIIVDDAIVVGEDSLAQYQAGSSPANAAKGGAYRMLAPVLSSSLTTVAAFLPLMMVSGIIGNILFDIPFIVICVIIASLIESFLVLPGHLRASLQSGHGNDTGRLRRTLDNGFDGFRERIFRPMVTYAVHRPEATIATGLACLIVAIGLLAGGRVPFNFFPSPETTFFTANVGFVSGTPQRDVLEFMKTIDRALGETEAEFDEALIKLSAIKLGEVALNEGRTVKQGDQFATLLVELVDSEARSVRNPDFIAAWKAKIPLSPGLETFSVVERRAGPPGRDSDVRLIGTDPSRLKAAAVQLGQMLREIDGVLTVEDDMPYGPAQLVYSVNAQGLSLGLSVESVGRQLRAAYDGELAQIYTEGDDEIEVRVVLPENERSRLDSLESFGISTPAGELIPLGSVVEVRSKRGFEVLRHADTKLAVQVSADIDTAVTTSNKVNSKLRDHILPEVADRYGVEFSMEGRAADQKETLSDMATGAMIAMALIYLVLAWVFSSYGWPLVVMTAIPFGLVGALGGHWAMGIDLTILSLFGFFGLSGIVVNDSIILVTFYKQLRLAGQPAREALVDAACLRLRAVLLTSLTTIGGLIPLLFETSLQAQFLIPMAVSIAFGLAFATVLVLLFIPSLLGVYESTAEWLQRRSTSTSQAVNWA